MINPGGRRDNGSNQPEARVLEKGLAFEGNVTHHVLHKIYAVNFEDCFSILPSRRQVQRGTIHLTQLNQNFT